MMNFNKDGAMRHRIDKGTVNYWPNRFEAVPPAKPEEGGFVSYPQKVVGKKERLLSKKFREHFSQAQLFYNSMSVHEKMHITNALGFELDHCDDPTVYKRMSERLSSIDLDLAKAVAVTVGGESPSKAATANHGRKAKGLSQMEYIPRELTIESRRIAVLIADGFDPTSYDGIVAAIKGARALPFTIGPRRQGVKSATGESIRPDHFYGGMRSTMFDAVFVPAGTGQSGLAKDGLARFWVREAFGHCKPIGGVGEGVNLIKAAVSEAPSVEVSAVDSDGVQNSYGVVTAGKISASDWGSKPQIAKDTKDVVGAFFYELSQHRHWKREIDGLVQSVSY